MNEASMHPRRTRDSMKTARSTEKTARKEGIGTPIRYDPMKTMQPDKKKRTKNEEGKKPSAACPRA